jgi:hypothetical protein
MQDDLILGKDIVVVCGRVVLGDDAEDVSGRRFPGVEPISSK